jgi:hypothetical protein
LTTLRSKNDLSGIWGLNIARNWVTWLQLMYLVWYLKDILLVKRIYVVNRTHVLVHMGLVGVFQREAIVESRTLTILLTDNWHRLGTGIILYGGPGALMI